MDLLATVARLLAYLGATLVIGAAALRLMEPPVSFDAQRAEARRRRPILAGWLLVGASLVLQLVAQARALELEPGIAPLRELLMDTTWGLGWSVLAASVLVGGVALLVRASMLLLLAALLVSVAMGGIGHAAADMEWPMLSRALDAAHVAAVGVWLGALVLLWRDGQRVARGTWERFSRAALVAAPLAVLTGLGSTLLRLRAATVGASLASDYGRLLVLKVVLALGVLALGAAHRRRIRATGAPVARGVRFELLLALAVFAVTSVLTGTSPPGE